MEVVLKNLTKVFPSRNKNGKEVVAVNNFDFTIPDGTILNSSDSIPNSSGNSHALSSDYYYGSIDTSCVIGDANGPAAGQGIHIAIRLGQRVDGAMEYTMLSEPIPVAEGTRIPVSFKNIRGALGVTEGTIEVYGVDNGTVYSSYVIGFGPLN